MPNPMPQQPTPKKNISVPPVQSMNIPPPDNNYHKPSPMKAVLILLGILVALAALGITGYVVYNAFFAPERAPRQNVQNTSQKKQAAVPNSMDESVKSDTPYATDVSRDGRVIPPDLLPYLNTAELSAEDLSQSFNQSVWTAYYSGTMNLKIHYPPIYNVSEHLQSIGGGVETRALTLDEVGDETGAYAPKQTDVLPSTIITIAAYPDMQPISLKEFFELVWGPSDTYTVTDYTIAGRPAQEYVVTSPQSLPEVVTRAIVFSQNNTYYFIQAVNFRTELYRKILNTLTY